MLAESCTRHFSWSGNTTTAKVSMKFHYQLDFLTRFAAHFFVIPLHPLKMGRVKGKQNNLLLQII